MRPHRFLLATLFFALASTPTLASDGVLEINQACAQGPGCFDGDAAGFPVSITSTNSYRLTSNLVIEGSKPSVVIEIADTAPSSTLDLNGFEVSCSECTLGIYAELVPYVTIGNGTLAIGETAKSNGTVVRLGAYGQVKDVIFRFTQLAGIEMGDKGRVEDVSLVQTGGNGIETGNTAQISNCTVVTLRHVTGITVGPQSRISNCHVQHISSEISGGSGIVGNSTFLFGNVVFIGVLETAIGGSGSMVNNYVTGPVSASFIDAGGNVCNGTLGCP